MSKSSWDIQMEILKKQVKNEIIGEIDELIKERLLEILGPAIADKIVDVLDFPYSVKQFADLTGYTKENIYKMCQRGQLAYKKRLKHIYIDPKEVKNVMLYKRNEW